MIFNFLATFNLPDTADERIDFRGKKMTKRAAYYSFFEREGWDQKKDPDTVVFGAVEAQNAEDAETAILQVFQSASRTVDQKTTLSLLVSATSVKNLSVREDGMVHATVKSDKDGTIGVGGVKKPKLGSLTRSVKLLKSIS